MVTKTISTTDRPIIKSAVGDENKIFAAAAGRIYFSPKGQKKWTLLQDAGGITFYQSLDSGILYFCLVDLNSTNGKRRWEQELYVDFKYHQDTESFHSFESDEGMVGFLFAESDDAESFYKTVSEQLELTAHSQTSPERKKKSRSIFSVFKFSPAKKKDKQEQHNSDTESISDRKKKKRNDELTHDDVSEPRDFRHLSHIGFNPEKGTFDVKNIPEDWKQLFDKAGITQEQLENKETANFIAGFVDSKKDMLKKPAVPKKKSAPPPPPSIPASKAKPAVPKKTPPPLPKSKPGALASRNTTSAPAPPPPPPAPAAVGMSAKTVSNDTHTALLESIKSAGPKVLKPVDTEAISDRPPIKEDSLHGSLMAAIRSGTTLRKTPERTEAPQKSPTESANGDSADIMAAMLAKALAARNKKLSMESEDDSEDSDDSRW